jgi:hypothetical protein
VRRFSITVFAIFTYPIQRTPPRSPTWEQKKGTARRTFSKERIEEAVGVGFIIATFFLTGWFYYSLYQALG